MSTPKPIVLIFAAALSLVFAGTAVAVERIALVLGNSAYVSVPHLPNPGNDARAVADMLAGLGFDTTLELDLDVAGMQAALTAFEEAAIGSRIAIVYYAGHGIEVDGRNFLIPIDAVLARDTDIEAEAVPLDRLLQATEGASQLRLIMLDACRNNPFLLDLQRVGGHSVGKGLARIELEGSALVSMAASEGKTAFDGTGEHSPYTEALLEHLPSPGLEVNYVFRRVRAAVQTVTANAQEPQYFQSLSADEIYLTNAPANAVALTEEDRMRVAYEEALAINSAEAYVAYTRAFPSTYYATLAEERIEALELAAQAQALESAPLEDVYWITIRGSSEPADFEAYLRRFPDGAYADLARARITALGRSQEVISALADGGPATDEATLRRNAQAQIDRIPFNMVQYGLVALGFNTAVNGIQDQPTRQAVRAYQASIEASQTGRLTAQQTVDLLLAAATVGDAYAQMTVGVMLADGIFWQTNYNLSRMWLARSANQDNPYAMTNLAILYRDGLGTAPDQQRARLLLRRAISLGDSGAEDVLRALELT